MQRSNADPTFTDLTVAQLGGPRAKAFFERCDAEIPFEQLAASVADIFDDGHCGGAPHWPVVTLLKIVFVQKCFGLSDPMAEEMLQDRISFRRFVGLSFDDKTPDHSTISVFRRRLREKGHGGTLIDATILEAPLGGKRADGSSSGDPAAGTTFKSNRVYRGFTAHVATDRRGLITDFVYDSAVVSEHTHFDHLARHEKKVVIADSGCRSKDRIARLKARGVIAAFCHRRVRGQKELTALQRRHNRLVAPLRAFVEHPFAWIKTRLNNRRVRYRGVARNALDFALSAVACNFCRSFTLKPIAISG